jgi:endoplasmic reticulum protein 29
MLNLLIPLSIILIAVPTISCCRGCTDLDDLSFSKVIKKFQYTLVKFDVAFPYGDKHEAYAELARELSTEKNLLIATVGIKDYGEKDNNELGAKYGAKEPFPVIRLFKDGSVENPISYETG